MHVCGELHGKKRLTNGDRHSNETEDGVEGAHRIAGQLDFPTPCNKTSLFVAHFLHGALSSVGARLAKQQDREGFHSDHPAFKSCRLLLLCLRACTYMCLKCVYVEWGRAFLNSSEVTPRRPYLRVRIRTQRCVCVCARAKGGGWRHIIEEGLYGSAGGSERRAPVLQRMTLGVPALAPSVYATLT